MHQLSRSSLRSDGLGRNREHLIYSAPVQVYHLKAPAFVIERFSYLWQATELNQGDGRVFTLFLWRRLPILNLA